MLLVAAFFSGLLNKKGHTQGSILATNGLKPFQKDHRWSCVGDESRGPRGGRLQRCPHHNCRAGAPANPAHTWTHIHATALVCKCICASPGSL